MDESNGAEESVRMIAEAIDFGTKVRFLAMDDACPPCRVFHGQVFEPHQIPRLPVAGCTHDICRCDYSPVTIFDR